MADGLLNNPVNQEGVDPQTQETFDAFVANGMKIIHNDKASDGILKTIADADDPVKAIADATLNVVERLEQSGGESGMNFDPSVLMQGANVLMGEIIMSAEMVGLKPLSDEEKYMAYSLAVSKYIDGAVKSGKMTQEQLGQMSQQAQQSPEGQKIVAEMGNMQQQGGAAAQPMPPNTGRV